MAPCSPGLWGWLLSDSRPAAGGCFDGGRGGRGGTQKLLCPSRGWWLAAGSPWGWLWSVTSRSAGHWAGGRNRGWLTPGYLDSLGDPRQTLGPLVGAHFPQVTQQGLLRLCRTRGLVRRQSDETEWTLLRAVVLSQTPAWSSESHGETPPDLAGQP